MTPSLANLRVLKVATEHPTFERAASELGVTNGAIRHAVRRLENDLGVTLFRREAREWRPTPAATRLAAAFSAAEGILQQTIEDILPGQSARPMRLSVDPDLWELWMEPAMAAAPDGMFHGVTPHIMTLSHGSEAADVRLTFDTPNVAGYRKRVLCALRLVLVGSRDVCAPSDAKQLLKGGKFPLFYPESVPDSAWSCGLPVRPARPHRLGSHRECLKRTLAGEGLALTFRIFARSMVEDGLIWYDDQSGANGWAIDLFIHSMVNSTSSGDFSRQITSRLKSKMIFDQEEFW